MEIKAQTTEKAFLDVNLYLIAKNANLMKQFGLQLKIFRILLIVSCILAAIFIFTKAWGGLVLSLIVVIISLSFRKFMMWLLRYNMKKQYKSAGYEGVDCALETNDDGLKWSNGKLDINSKIRDIKRILEVREYFFIDLDATVSLALDKATIGDSDNIREELESYSAMYNIPFDTKLDWNTQKLSSMYLTNSISTTK